MLPTNIHSNKSFKDVYYKCFFLFTCVVFFVTMILLFVLYPEFIDQFAKELDFQKHQFSVCSHPLTIQHSSRLRVSCESSNVNPSIETLFTAMNQLLARLSPLIKDCISIVKYAWIVVILNVFCIFLYG